jgi:hypothetical protein
MRFRNGERRNRRLGRAERWRILVKRKKGRGRLKGQSLALEVQRRRWVVKMDGWRRGKRGWVKLANARLEFDVISKFFDVHAMAIYMC